LIQQLLYAQRGLVLLWNQFPYGAKFFIQYTLPPAGLLALRGSVFFIVPAYLNLTLLPDE